MSGKLPLILVPPSEGKSTGGSSRSWEPGTMRYGLDDQRLEMIAALKDAMSADESSRARLLGVKGEALRQATETNLALRSAPTKRAIDRYSGVLYGELDAGSLSSAAKRRLGSSVVIFSGLWGMVSPTDLIPDYKLKMGASLPEVGRLNAFWRGAISEELSRISRGRRIWNLLPNEHDSAWRAAPGTPQCSVKFLDRRADGALVAVSHWNKLLKGSLLRHLLEAPLSTPEDLGDWQHPLGYRLDPALTDDRDGRLTLSMVRVDDV